MSRSQSPILPPTRWLDRRRFLSDAASALGAIAVTSLLGGDGLLASDANVIDPSRPNQPRPSHYPGAAKNVIVIFCAGGVSHLDTWDYKPELEKQDGKPLAGGPAVTFQGPSGELARPQYKFRPRGETGKMVSDMLPHLAELTDDFAFVHSLTSKSNTHGPAENFLSTGSVLDGFPSLGAWVTYALGCETQELPAYVAIPDPRGVPQNGSNNWGPGFLPAAFQGTTFSAASPIRNLQPYGSSSDSDEAARQFLARMNERHFNEHPHDSKLAARIASYELAARMQLSVPNVTNLDSEPEHILKLYGADSTDKHKAAFARNCILARRLVEKGVRFVQLFNGAYASGGALNWDGHNKLKEQYDTHANILDQPAAALIRDLKQRGLLEDTLVVWCTEFGRMPMFQKGAKGRDHNPDGFTCWMTGAGVKPGVSHGATDEFGAKAIQDVHPLYDFNATILHLLGLNHEQLTVRHNGIDRRLTNVEGHVIHEILASHT
ncbi:DUF1501 domain-containing protein [Blastopirellula sp. JC732]|uniref:DUF1501 domain-containing protein n=1 Tax=Blastopirellula sediminis TaxID=2894196 RepID=A0A9X1MM33_9BACT|nr:DUF1501 domain-containing protein [Blastopirellula sediminis]MCC9608483.1 DUF1501 domain-containing protein [Blastopirellula sediminis]MCC9628740.1 DUF1501 domain-containing protein [Blastopirellula sediminis]